MAERSESPVTNSVGRHSQALPIIDPATNKPADDAVNPALTFAASVFNTDIELETLDAYIAEYVPHLVVVAFDEWFARKDVTSAIEFWSALIDQIVGMRDSDGVANRIIAHLDAFALSRADYDLDDDDVEFFNGVHYAISQFREDVNEDDDSDDSEPVVSASSSSSSSAFGHSAPASAELHSLIDGSHVGIVRTSRGKLFLVSVRGTKLFNPFNGKPLFSVNGMLSDLDTHKALPWCRSVLLGSELVDEASGERVRLPA